MQPPASSIVDLGLPSAVDLDDTAATIAAAQHGCGAIPWDVTGDAAGKVDPWDHVECAMALTAAGWTGEAETAYAWLAAQQRADGTWPLEWRLRGDELVVVDAGVDSNQCGYVAVGVWHHWLVRRDLAFVERMWPVVASALDAVVALQLPGGGIAWGRGAGGAFDEALLTGSSSIAHALSFGLELARLVEAPRPAWRRALTALTDAVRRHCSADDDASSDADSALFGDRRRFSMDWYYPILGGVLRGEAAHARIAARWDDFVVPGLGIHCVDDHPWVTGAETCELALALEACGRREDAVRLVADMQHLRHDDGSYWTGYVYADDARWPIERSTWTSAAVILACDALLGLTPGAGVFRLDA